MSTMARGPCQALAAAADFGEQVRVRSQATSSAASSGGAQAVCSCSMI